MVVNRNFGCGSSREHAAWALHDFGIRAVLAPSFADIHRENDDQNGIAAIELPSDVIETLLLNIFFAREISTMVPRLPFFNGEFDLIRPFAYIEEKLLKRFARESGLPVILNPCPTAKTSKRKYIKELLTKLEKDHRGIKENIFKAMRHIKPDYLLGDQEMPIMTGRQKT